MGSPKKDERVDVVKVPELAEKIRVLKTGDEISSVLKIDRKALVETLEVSRGLILPMVSWLDAQILSASEMEIPHLQKFRKSRGVKLYDKKMDIWLERGGKWFIRPHRGSVNEAMMVNSKTLAEIIIERGRNFLNREAYVFPEEEVLLRDMSFYQGAFIELTSAFYEAVQKLIAERQKRLDAMAQKANLLKDFADALDPLLSEGKEVAFQGHSIFRKKQDRPGETRYSGDYLCPEDLKPFWDIIADKHGTWEGYYEHKSTYSCRTLKEVLFRAGVVFKDISDAKDRSARELWGCNYGRMPLSLKERETLKAILRSVFYWPQL